MMIKNVEMRQLLNELNYCDHVLSYTVYSEGEKTIVDVCHLDGLDMIKYSYEFTVEFYNETLDTLVIRVKGIDDGYINNRIVSHLDYFKTSFIHLTDDFVKHVINHF